MTDPTPDSAPDPTAAASPASSSGTSPAAAPVSPRHANRLARETSPYLLQHAHNPVDWYPWGEEAFARARAEDKPILLSVGYATCHWCHVMERESFEDEALARVLGEGFIAIKVDREELPDVDHVYMSALQALTGHGGWPMNMFLTPQLEPFYGGSYFPPTARHGLPSFTEVLGAVSAAWRSRRDELVEQARTLVEHVRALGTAGQVASAPAHRLHARAVATIAKSFDRQFGGFGDAPKFPQSPLLQYLLAVAAAGNATARSMLVTTLHRMSEGGLVDHVGGGFARYSTDRRWHVPHFEKMLCDNAQLVRVYLGAWRLTGDNRLRSVAEDTIAYLLREMRPDAAPAAFSSAQDADAEGVEGRFHVWSAAQLREVLGADAAAAARLYGVTETGNWAHGSGEPAQGANVLERRDAPGVRSELGLDEGQFERWERALRERLYAARAKRVWPITDDKVLADWNAMALRAFAEAGRLLGRRDLVEAARALAGFVLSEMTREGTLRHAWRNGVLRDETYLGDLAQAGLGLLELHAATAEPRWLFAAREQAAQLVERFHDPEQGFFDAAAGALPVRARDLFDGSTPSGSAAACELLLRLSGPCDRADWAQIARDTIARQEAIFAKAPAAMPAMLHARLLADHGADLALPTAAGVPPLGLSIFAPLATIVAGPPDAPGLLAGRVAGEAYLCRYGRCELPARTIDELRAQLDALHDLPEA
ncbi:MAG: thioredoxin domain-containing protein [Burkholderiaceae bacterium]|nr:thioredoxin domain-containing protein [Burkholderiaceae bacterium]